MSTGDGPLFPSMLDSSMISRSDTSGESGRGNGSMANLDQSGQDPSTQKYACSRCGRSYLHQVMLITNWFLKSCRALGSISCLWADFTCANTPVLNFYFINIFTLNFIHYLEPRGMTNFYIICSMSYTKIYWHKNCS